MVNVPTAKPKARTLYDGKAAYMEEEFARDPGTKVLLPADSDGHLPVFINQIEQSDRARPYGHGVHTKLGGSVTRYFAYPPYDTNPAIKVSTPWKRVSPKVLKEAGGTCILYAPVQLYQSGAAPIKVSVLFAPDGFAHARVGVRGLMREKTKSNRVLVILSPVFVGKYRAGWPATDFVIKNLLEDVNLDGRPFEVDVLGAYSYGHRGMHLTLSNLDYLTSISKEPTLIYFDNIYNMHDGDGPPSTVELITKEIRSELKEGTKEINKNKLKPKIVMYAGTSDGLSAKAEPTKDAIEKAYPGRFYFVDMRSGGLAGNLNKKLMVLTYCRIFQAAQTEGYFLSAPPPVHKMLPSLPKRGDVFSSELNKKPPWLSDDQWKGDWLGSWSDPGIDTCYGKQVSWLGDYLKDHEGEKGVRNYRLLGWSPPDSQLVVHDGLVAEFAWELLLR